MIGVYLSGTGNTKHCVERLVHLMDDTAQCVPIEDAQIESLLEKECRREQADRKERR